MEKEIKNINIINGDMYFTCCDCGRRNKSEIEIRDIAHSVSHIKCEFCDIFNKLT